MDTDDLTPMAYATLALAYQACEPMRAEIGAAASDYCSEDDYLKGVGEFLEEILEAPDDYLELWNLDQELDVTVFERAVEGVLAHVRSTLATSRAQRGKPPFEK